MQFIAIPRSINGRNRSQAWGLAGGLDPEHRYQSGIDDVNVFFLTGT